MRIEFNPKAVSGQQFVIVGAERDAVAVLVARGVDQLDAEKRIVDARHKARRGLTTERIEAPAPRKRDADAEIVESFIYEDRFLIAPGQRVTFSSFYDAFVATLSPTDRQLWTKKRVSLALPQEHPSVAGPSNVRYVQGLADAA